ncbi:MAG: WecB/TagA/CpsF family glycosyltransferase [Candidatus Omnitrophica bacterium]|nr:WecB/TagA/CpsF family glycosyltransferase [Candidatus Omnitrophota bacterium]
MPADVETFDLLGVHVSVLDLDKAARLIIGMVQKKSRGYVCVAPVSTIVDARRSPGYRDIINKASLVTPDGMPVVWYGRARGFKDVKRTYGPDLMLKLCDVGQAVGLRHFFYGGTPAVCDKVVKFLKAQFPGISIVGTMSPPYMEKAELLSPETAEEINRAEPDIVWVGLGSPKQDYWMSLNQEVLKAPVVVGIGAAFDFHAGIKPQAPLWMQRSGLEWLFRLCSEPQRLWKRYLIGNVLFLWWVLQDLCFKTKKSR